MLRAFHVLGLLAAVALLPSLTRGGEISGEYLEMRTCAVYTGPCFANAEVGLTGHEALMAWNIEQGRHNGVDLAGLKVVVAVNASDTLGYGGGVVVNPDPIKSVILADAKASTEQREALVDFAKTRAGKLAGDVRRVDFLPIEMQLDHVDMAANLNVGKEVALKTRKLVKGDCVCTNEVVYYPPLAQVDNAAPAFTLEGKFSGQGLGVQWSDPNTRSAFLATFDY